MNELYAYIMSISTTIVIDCSFIIFYFIISYQNEKWNLDIYMGYLKWALIIFLLSSTATFIYNYVVYFVEIEEKRKMLITIMGRFSILSFGLRLLSFSIAILGSLRSIMEINHNDLKLGKRWNWSAFLFCPIWSLFHRKYWGVLSFVPGIGIVISVYFSIFSGQYKRTYSHVSKSSNVYGR